MTPSPLETFGEKSVHSCFVQSAKSVEKKKKEVKKKMTKSKIECEKLCSNGNTKVSYRTGG